MLNTVDPVLMLLAAGYAAEGYFAWRLPAPLRFVAVGYLASPFVIALASSAYTAIRDHATNR